jgi:hypothetical protein
MKTHIGTNNFMLIFATYWLIITQTRNN